MKTSATRVGAVLSVTTLVGAFGGISGTSWAGDIDADLAVALDAAAPGERVSALMYMFDETDLLRVSAELDARRATLKERHEVIVRALHETADRGQLAILADLQRMRDAQQVESYQGFWIHNIVQVVGSPEAIRQLAAREDVATAFLDYPIELIDPVKPGRGDAVGGDMIDGDVTPGVEAVRAPEVWALGIDGTGVVVANIDTGVDGNHPALSSRWRGNESAYAGHPEWAFLDPLNGLLVPPFDSGSHGTHTMGSVVGGAPGEQIGVAPGAQWIASAAIDRAGIAQTVTDAIESFQWIVDPDGDPGTNFDVPAVCSNSWGLVTAHGYPECDETFWVWIDAAEAAGIVIIFSAGNEGTAGLRRPADRASDEYNAFAVAAVSPHDPSWPIAGFSSRGPTFCTPGGAPAIKPDIAAPGVDTRSSVPGGGYTNFSGTSMASPHVNGVVALMRQANPDLAVPQIKQIIYDTAFDLGTTGEDNAYGYGMIDAFEAVQMALSQATVQFTFPDGHPEFVHPAGGTTLSVRIAGQAATPDPDTALMHYSITDEFISVPVAYLGADEYEAVFPAVPCGADVAYYFSIETTDGELVLNPFNAPGTTYSAIAFAGSIVTYVEDFEVDTGWTVQSVDLLDGPWERGVPAGGDVVPGDRGDPPADADGSGQCYVTDNAPGNSDVDGGPTTLTSPGLDASGLPEARIEYRRWFTNDDAAIPGSADFMIVELSNDDGGTWTELEVVANSGGWVTKAWRISDFMTPTDQMRIRFIADDQPNDSVTEAGVDGIRVFSFTCGDIEGDVTGDGVVDVQDLLAVVGAWGPCSGCPEDIDGDGAVGTTDLLIVLAAWTD